MPTYCACQKMNDIDHALSCKTGGYTIFRHNRIRDTIAEILREVCTDVVVEPPLTPLESDTYTDGMNNRMNTTDGARLDIACIGLFSPLERTYMDVRIFHAGAPSYRNRTLPSLYTENENSKKRQYNSRVINIEKSTFTPLVFSTSGGMGKECKNLIRRCAYLISNKRGERYADVMSHITTRIRMALLKSTLISIRGYRGKQKINEQPLDAIPFNLVPGTGDPDCQI